MEIEAGGVFFLFTRVFSLQTCDNNKVQRKRGGVLEAMSLEWGCLPQRGDSSLGEARDQSKDFRKLRKG